MTLTAEWIRKKRLSRLDGADIRITLGTQVRCDDGREGIVVESGRANRWACKTALGTIEGFRVRWGVARG